MMSTDARWAMGMAYAEWKRCHADFLDLACRAARGAAVVPDAAASCRVDVERAMAELVSVSPQCGLNDDGVDDAEGTPGLLAVLERAPMRALHSTIAPRHPPEGLTCPPTS